jgi:hypothetical protein
MCLGHMQKEHLQFTALITYHGIILVEPFFMWENQVATGVFLQTVSGTANTSSIFTQLIFEQDLIAYSHCESFKSYLISCIYNNK